MYTILVHKANSCVNDKNMNKIGNCVMRSALEPHPIVKHLLIQRTHLTSKISFSENQKGSSTQPKSALDWPAHHKADSRPAAFSKTWQGDSGDREATFPNASRKLTISQVPTYSMFINGTTSAAAAQCTKAPSQKGRVEVASAAWLQGQMGLC